MKFLYQLKWFERFFKNYFSNGNKIKNIYYFKLMYIICMQVVLEVREYQIVWY